MRLTKDLGEWFDLRMLHRVFNGLAQLQPEVKPLPEIFGQAHAHLFG